MKIFSAATLLLSVRFVQGKGFADPMPIQLPSGNFAVASPNGSTRFLIPRGDQKKSDTPHRNLKASLQQVVTFDNPSPTKNLDFNTWIWLQLPSDTTGTLTLTGAKDAEFELVDADSSTGEIDMFIDLDVPGYYQWSIGGQEKGSFTYAVPKSVSGGRESGAIMRTNAAVNTAVEEAAYESGGAVTEAVGRIYYSSYGVDYACTGTAIRDNKSGRSIILTAAHCVWDDIDEIWGSDAIFIPNRDANTGATLEEDMTLEDIHRECADDICGCWDLSGGVVHDLWPSTPWPERLAYDYGFWVVDDEGAHTGASCGSDALDVAVSTLDFKVDEDEDVPGSFIHAFGYSLEYNPDFRYCSDNAGNNEATEGVFTHWLDGCRLTGGGSGGPWIKNFDPATGTGDVVSVQSWSYSSELGAGAPYIDASTARCLVNEARDVDIAWLKAQPDGEQGVFVSCFDRPCVEDDEEGLARKLLRMLRGERRLCSTKLSKEEAALYEKEHGH